MEQFPFKATGCYVGHHTNHVYGLTIMCILVASHGVFR